MGVRGLTTFIDERQRIHLLRTKFSEQCFVIDGSSLIYHIYDEAQLDTRHGGDYAQFQKTVKHFFAQLKRCETRSIVILDGASDERKRLTHINRMQNNIEYLHAIMVEHKRKLLLPILAREMFQQTLEELKVPFCYSLHDADQEIAAAANKFNAFVVSNDSDYYIFPLHRGYIPLKTLSWEQVFTDENGTHMYGHLYNVKSLTSQYKLKLPNLAFMPILLGCDWIDIDVCSGLVNRITQKKKEKKKSGRRRAKKIQQNKVDCTLKWLAKNEADCIANEILTSAKASKLNDTIEWCLELYRNIPETTAVLNTLEEQLKCLGGAEGLAEVTIDTEMPSEGRTADVQSTSEELHVSKLTRLGKFPSLVRSIANGNIDVLLPVVVGDFFQESPHQCSSDVRTATFTLVRKGAITEYDRTGGKYCKVGKCRSNHTTCSCQSTDDLLEWKKPGALRAKSSPKRRQYLLECLVGCVKDTEDRHNEFADCSKRFPQNELLAAVTLYWVLKTQPPPSLVSSLLLAFVAKQAKSDDVFGEFPVYDDQLELDDRLIHRMSEFQSCLKYCLMLNKVLGKPLREMSLCFDSSLVAAYYGRICHAVTVKAGKSLQDVWLLIPVLLLRLLFSVPVVDVWLL
ncbi:unnamed protein product [Clavelina lepadiformis]|uniref:Asteroid domain-containing protein n=1 Tax=Clavelina lepadiformis TaxID=159417 RepID=A0ABP0FWN7_CLALP